ncbi:hypothetical protein [Streptomyces sp. CFMR 7]|uniref:hypothetical protein n=1 Tax=Streptomyces sp. CFMR 7 TaxID=1649184 RepID=UPI0011A9DCBD|nr:hypothetical protein [Streptomyces sp. CFMR 7]
MNQQNSSKQVQELGSGDPRYFSKSEAGKGEALYERMLAELTGKYGEPGEVRDELTLHVRVSADKARVVKEAQKAGLDVAEADVIPDPDTGILTIDGMDWWDWLEAMTLQ